MRSLRPITRPGLPARQANIAILAAAAGFGALGADPAEAAGFQLNEQSVRGLGRAFSGETALGGDASSLWYNPALATDFDTPIATVGVSGVFPSGRLRNEGSTITGPGTRGLPLPISGPDGRDMIADAALANVSAIVPVSPDVAVGLNVNAPFGDKTRYPSAYFGRYDSTRTSLNTINVQGSVAWRISRRLSVGGGLDAQRAKATLENALPNLAPGAPDGMLRVSGKDWRAGWNVGAAWRPTGKLRLGASYRSSMSHHLKGAVQVGGLTGPLSPRNGEHPASTRLPTPAVASVGLAYELSPEWTLTAQGNRYLWSRFEELRVASRGSADLVTPENYRDSLSVAVGAERKLGTKWKARLGVMAEQTPTRAKFRSTQLPDSNRLWLTTGATWVASPRLSLDVGLAYVLLRNAALSREDILYASSPAATAVAINANARGNALVGGVGGSWRF